MVGLQRCPCNWPLLASAQPACASRRRHACLPDIALLSDEAHQVPCCAPLTARPVACRPDGASSPGPGRPLQWTCLPSGAAATLHHLQPGGLLRCTLRQQTELGADVCRLGHSAAGKHLPVPSGCLHQAPQDPVLSACLGLSWVVLCMCPQRMCAVWEHSCSLQASTCALTKPPSGKSLRACRAWNGSMDRVCCGACAHAALFKSLQISNSVQVLANHMGISDPPDFQQMMSQEVALLLSKPVRARCASGAAAWQQRTLCHAAVGCPC